MVLLSVAKTSDKVCFGKYEQLVFAKNSSNVLLVLHTFVDEKIANEYTGSDNSK